MHEYIFYRAVFLKNGLAMWISFILIGGVAIKSSVLRTYQVAEFCAEDVTG